MRDLNLTLLQTNLSWQDPAANRDRFADLISTHASDSDLIVLPEMFSTGFSMDAAQLAEKPNGPTVAWLQETARQHDVAVTGSLIVKDGDDYYNRLIWAAADGAEISYDKRHLFRMAGEDKHFSAGRSRVVVELQGWRICPLICYDLRFPVWSRNRDEYDLLLYVANWPAARHSAWTSLLPARAVENLCYCAGLNRTGTDGNDIAYAGGSAVFDYLGNALTSADESETVLQATLSAAKLERYRTKFPAWKDADAFKIL